MKFIYKHIFLALLSCNALNSLNGIFSVKFSELCERTERVTACYRKRRLLNYETPIRIKSINTAPNIRLTECSVGRRLIIQKNTFGTFYILMVRFVVEWFWGTFSDLYISRIKTKYMRRSYICCVFGRHKIWGFTLESTVSYYATSLFSGIPESSENSCRKICAY